jgi:hypothetical protein
MAVNYNDPRFQQVNNEKQTALNEVNSMYNNMVNSTDKMYQDQIQASEDYAKVQTDLQQQQSDFAIEQIEQNKEWAEQDYTKEQKASYSDYQKASNSYGANSEAMASRGLTGTGYAESSQVSMFNAYQNRVATARESFNRAVIEYDNQIKDAQLQNNSALAEISFQALQKKLELSLAGFQYKNSLLEAQLNAKQQTEDRYYSRWQNVLNQINTENALAEQQRQFNEQMALERQAYSIASSGGSGGSGGGSGSSGGSSGGSVSGASASGSTKPKDYYFSNGYQPQYIGNTKVSKSGLKVSDVFMADGSDFSKQNIWSANGKYYVWVGSGKKSGNYVDVTDKVKTSLEKRVNFKWGR